MRHLDIIDLGERVKEARRAKRMTQARLAEIVGISRTRVIAFELGYAPELSFRSVLLMLNAVDLDLRLGAYNHGRPTLEDLRREQEEEDEREARRGGPRPRW